jgi:hypothetical protein
MIFLFYSLLTVIVQFLHILGVFVDQCLRLLVVQIDGERIIVVSSIRISRVSVLPVHYSRLTTTWTDHYHDAKFAQGRLTIGNLFLETDLLPSPNGFDSRDVAHLAKIFPSSQVCHPPILLSGLAIVTGRQGEFTVTRLTSS